MNNIITKIILAFLAIVAALTYIGIRVYSNGKAVIATNQEILRSYDIISHNKDAASQAKDMVLATRGFLLTEDSSYLKPYFSAMEKTPKTIAILKENASIRQEMLQNKSEEDGKIYDKVIKLENLLETRKNYSVQYVVARQEKGINSAIAMFKMRKNGNVIMDSIRQITNEIEELENNWLENKLQNRESQYKELRNMIFWLAGLITVTLALVIWILSRDITGRVRAEQDLKSLNQNLEQQVEARTQELKRSFEDMETKVKFRNLELEQQNIYLHKRIAELEK